MAEMDRRYGALLHSIEDLRDSKVLAQTKRFEQHKTALENSHRNEILSSFFVLLFVLGVAFYGGKMSQLVKSSSLRDAHLAGIVSTSQDAIISKSTEGIITTWNQGAEKMFGYTSAEVIGKPMALVIPERLQNEEIEILKKIKSGQSTHNSGTKRITKSGNLIDVSFVVSPLRGDDNKIVGASVIIRDITPIMQANNQVNRIFSHSMDLMCIASTDGTFKKVSPSFTKILGFEEHELLSRPFVDYIHPDDLSATAKIVETLSQGIPLIDFENRYRTKSGDYKLISWVCEPDPATGLLYATGRNVTELRNSEYRNKQILQAIDGSAIVAFTDTKGKITEVNDNFCKISGYSREELIGKDHRTINSGQHPKSFFTKLWSNIQAGQTWTADIENKNKNGDHYFVRSVISPIKNINGKIDQFMAVRFDVTEQKKSESDLKTALNLNEAIRRSAKFAIITSDIEGTITGFNEEAERILGYSATEMIGKLTPAIFHDPNEVVETAKQLSKELNTNVPVGFDTFVFKARLGQGYYDERQWTYIRKDGKRVPVRLNVTGLYDTKGKLYGFMGIAKDITEEIALHSELELEKAKSVRNAKLASLGEMSAGIAHEINNPLAIISGSVGLLAKFSDNPIKLASKVETIKKSCDRIARIVTGLKKFSRSGDKATLEKHELCDIVKEASILVESKSKRHSTPVTLDCKSHSYVLCDEVEIEQVLVNLINNAIDAVKTRAEKWVTVSLFDDADSVVLRVADSGPGIPEPVRNKLFEPFFTTKKVGEGTGLGLSIAKGILDEHNATISIIADSPNTCFEIRFPRAEQTKNAA